MTVTLGIECSQRQGGVALRTSGGAVVEASLKSASGVDDQLMPAVDRLFRKAGLRPDDLRLIAVSIGPGGFTGLRVAVTTTRMLSMSLGCDVVAIPSAIVAAGSRGMASSVVVLAASKRGSAWMTQVSPDLHIEGVPGLVTADGLAARLPNGAVVLADMHLDPSLRAAVAAAGLATETPVLRPRALIDCGVRAAERGETVDPRFLEPLYAREPEAVRLFQARPKPA